MAKTKGVSFVHAKSFCDERGPTAWPGVLGRLPRVDQDEIASVVAVGWYDLALYARFLHALDAEIGGGDLAAVVELGRFQAERDLKIVHRLFFRLLTSPAYAIEKTAEYWRRFHDSGAWTITRSGDGHVSGCLDGWGVDAALCAELTGYMPRMIDLCGGKNATMAHPRCRARGAARCEFEMGWQP
ncbi:MAG: hypothetical protein IT377_29960 [Polyangiaceae bacterium]|nr:hypothetical protein [Polyangiaceae bacterium]